VRIVLEKVSVPLLSKTLLELLGKEVVEQAEEVVAEDVAVAAGEDEVKEVVVVVSLLVAYVGAVEEEVIHGFHVLLLPVLFVENNLVSCARELSGTIVPTSV
jgi:hypothetical protein